jgi:multidrug efflux system membrane fusion protein
MLENNEIQNRSAALQKEDAVKANPAKTPAVEQRRVPLQKKILAGIFVLLVLGGVWWWVKHHQAASVEKKSSDASRAGAMPIPVKPGTVVQKDVPIFLDGIGTVQAFNTVTVHVRVDGQLEKIAFTEGQDVHAGDLLAQIDAAPFKAQLEQNKAKKDQDDAQLSNARLDLIRDTAMLAKNAVTQQKYDTQKALVDQLDATVKSDKAAIDSAQVQLDYTTIVSPIDGRTGIRLVDQGNIVHAADANGLVVVAQLHPISLVFTLPEQSLNDIHKQMASGELTVLAVDRDNSTTLSEGKLSAIDNEIDTTTGTIKLKATFQNDDLQLWPGQFVNARLHLTTHKDGLVVPASVIQRGPDGSYAFVIKPDQTVEIRPVKVAQIDKGEALIDDGLKVGERVVVDGQYKLQVGSHVKLGDTPGKPKASSNSGGNELK